MAEQRLLGPLSSICSRRSDRIASPKKFRRWRASRKRMRLQRNPLLPHLVMPEHHEIRAGDVVMRRLRGSLAAAASAAPTDFAKLLLVPGVGARTVRALAMVAEVVHGAPCRFSDPA